MLTDQELKLLALCIQHEIQKEFTFIRLSGNLKDSIRIEKGEKDSYNIIISAPSYDVREYKKTGQKIYKPGKSYASEVDKTGGFSGVHKDYIEKCINKALDRWLLIKSSEYSLKSRS